MAGPGCVIASAVGKEIVKKLGKFIEEETAMQWRFKEDVLDMGEKMKNLECHLLDADKSRQEIAEGGRVGQEWLTKCKHVSYDTEDVLDELDANKLIKKSHSKFKLWFSRNNQLLQRITMPHKIKNVSKKIDEIKEEGIRDLGLQRGQREKTEGSINNEPFAPIIGEGIGTGMMGRKTEKEKLIGMLTSEADADISIIPVVGLGGIGKTTLVQSVLDDKRVNVFEVKVFVHVSKQINLQKIVTLILKFLNSTIMLDNNCTLSILHRHLKEELAGKRYLIVLDDLWEEDGDKLEGLKKMLQYGRKGSRIVVTTRHQSVVQSLCTGHLANIRKICPVPEFDQINLDILSSEDCWGLMKLRAFGPYDDQSGLEAIGREIAEKCGGLPLVANALGQVMSESKNVEAWQNIRDTKVNLGLRDEDQKEALEKLMLSYYYMKRDFKMCFAYLAVFPNGFVMNSNHLIQQWHALGYINSRHDGQRCINYLLGMSFLKLDQNTPLVAARSLHANAPPHLVMHDMAHDLASIIFANEFIDLDATQSTNGNKARYCRHVRLTKYKNDPEVFKHMPIKVRSVHLEIWGDCSSHKRHFLDPSTYVCWT